MLIPWLRGLSAPAALAAACALAAPARACDTSPYRSRYGPGAAALSDEGQRTLETMRMFTRNDGILRLSGHKDTAGPAEGNLRLAERRVEGARAFLVSLGMPPSRIRARSFGESRSITALEDGTSSSRHRYLLVELLSPAEARKGRFGRAKRSCGDG